MGTAPDAALCRGCNTPLGRAVLADWYEEHGVDLVTVTGLRYPAAEVADIALIPGERNNGYGYGYGNGNGDGDGYGYGYGYGNGDGNGNDDGNDDGDGYGYGYGYGYGDGYGNGYGNGYGYGNRNDNGYAAQHPFPHGG
jgi:hypothetical protein